MSPVLSTFGRRFHKLTQLLEQPGLVRLHRLGVGPDSYNRFRKAWFTELGIGTVLDIGANTGQFAQLVHAVLPEANVYSFEPLPDCYQELVRRTAGLERVRAFNVGLGGREDTLTFYRNRYADSSSFRPMTELHKRQFPFTDGADVPLSVPVRTLDSFRDEIEIRGSLMAKVDVQGFEDEVIAGGRELLSQAKLVIMEVSFAPLYEGVPTFDSLYATMKGMGFEFRGFVDQLVGPVDGAVLQGDAMFLKSGS